MRISLDEQYKEIENCSHLVGGGGGKREHSRGHVFIPINNKGGHNLCFGNIYNGKMGCVWLKSRSSNSFCLKL